MYATVEGKVTGRDSEVNLLYDRSSAFSAGNVQIQDGTEPANRILEKDICANAVFFTNEGKTQLLSNINVYNNSVFKVDNDAIVVGIHPTNFGMLSMFNSVRLFMVAMVAGIEPVTNGMPPKLRETRPERKVDDVVVGKRVGWV